MLNKGFVAAKKELTIVFNHQICGRLFHNICAFNTSMVHYDKAIAIALELNDQQRFSSELGNLALTYNSIGRFKDAVNCLKASLNTCERLDNIQGQISQLQTLGNVYRNMGQYDLSEKTFLSASRIIENKGDDYDLCTTFGNLITLYNKTGDYSNTILYGQKALDLSRKLGIKQSEGSILCSLGSAYYNLGNVDRGIENMQKGIEVGQLIGNTNLICLGQTNLALIYSQEHQPRVALGLLLEASPLSLNMGTHHNSGLIFMAIGQNYVSLRDTELAMTNFLKAKKIFEEVFEADHTNLEILRSQIASIHGAKSSQ